MVEFIGDMAKIREMSRGQIMGYVRDILLDRAKFIRVREESAVLRLGFGDWDASLKATHDALSAAALAIEAIITKGKDQVSRGVNVDPLVDNVVEVIRSGLIQEITNRQSAGPSIVEDGDVAP
jgi:hypothetical protein